MLWLVLTAYLSFGFWIGWLMLDMGNKHGGPSQRWRALKQEPGYIWLWLALAFLWLPGIIYIIAQNRKVR